ncbi:MAG: hypothetical protein NC400_04840 [Clostridium sp.]|nr:hypothetical protein [Clostridium sp.]
MDNVAITTELTGSLEKIIKFAEWGEEQAAPFRESVAAYKKLSDKNSGEASAAQLRRKITDMFYKLYEAAFRASVRKGVLPPVVRMFFEFGYVDEELAGMENAVYLYGLSQNMPTCPEKGVYSIYEWLTAIYQGKKEPSRNEMDMDFRDYVLEQKKKGRITQSQETALLQNGGSKVLYELTNMLPVINRLTFGQLSIFCPLFSAHNLFKSLEATLVTAEKVTAEIEGIRNKDFKAFYRETRFYSKERGVQEQIEVEVLPDIILMPNIGSRSIMWQEVEGKKRTTPSRMMLSVFHTEDLPQSIMRLTGEFRWEMCKRAQGARWNDITEPSLTSEYCDYVQFYRNSKELSPDAKEKIKRQLTRARNNYRSMFVMDYITWLLYESNGSPRLNKAARNILFTYCPFKKEVREKIGVNPLYKPAMERYNIMNSKVQHRIALLYRKLENTPEGVPTEIEEYKNYLEL